MRSVVLFTHNSAGYGAQANLRSLAAEAWVLPREIVNVDIPAIPTDSERVEGGLSVLGKRWARAGYNLVPLVTAEMALRCSIDITLLRPEEERLIFRSGDIDGQLKTLFDAFRLPSSTDETGGATPSEDEDLLF